MIQGKKTATDIVGIYIILLSFSLTVYSQAETVKMQPVLRLMFYNVENFFDTDNDPLTNDDEYTPEGKRYWSVGRYINKRNNIFKVIANVGEWEPPSLISLCEIENRKVLEGLIRNTPLTKYQYGIIHKDSPDQRGIDVALIYRKDLLRPVRQQFIPYPDRRRRTRDILFVTLLTQNKDTLHLFINHWPSRSGGQKKSEPARILTASILRQKVDSIFARNANANIVITGDLNDEPLDKSIISGLKAKPDISKTAPSALYNLTALKMKEKTGTIKYQGRWLVYDQMIVSGAMLKPGNKLETGLKKCTIFRADYLLEPDKRYSGTKPFRTYSGLKYNKGFSDHLPVVLDITLN